MEIFFTTPDLNLAAALQEHSEQIPELIRTRDRVLFKFKRTPALTEGIFHFYQDTLHLNARTLLVSRNDLFSRIRRVER